jgi:hypothetical protein
MKERAREREGETARGQTEEFATEAVYVCVREYVYEGARESERGRDSERADRQRA